ncbi:MAG: protein kinase family protein, partial [Mycobacteriales bacterium]
MTQVGTPTQGELLAGRYRLGNLVGGNQHNGYSLWHGKDDLLSRDVSIELRVPGGDSATSMIAAASSAGRIQHANIVGVYDAVDEGERAFVVREWVEGKTLTETIRVDGPFDPYRAAALARAAADAIAAIHATGMTHGRLTPNTVLLNEEGEPNFIDLELSESGEVQADIRAIGGLLYASLTGAWPLEASGDFTDLPEAARVDGQLCSPRQLRAGIPGYLDALAMDLLDSSIGHSDAATLAQELRRYDIADPDLGPLTT